MKRTQDQHSAADYGSDGTEKTNTKYHDLEMSGNIFGAPENKCDPWRLRGAIGLRFQQKGFASEINTNKELFGIIYCCSVQKGSLRQIMQFTTQQRYSRPFLRAIHCFQTNKYQANMKLIPLAFIYKTDKRRIPLHCKTVLSVGNVSKPLLND